VKSILNVLPLLILTTFLLSSCSSVKQLEIFKTEVPRAKLEEKNIDPVLFGLTDDDYETLAVNFAQIRAYMIKQKLTLDQYREYYEPTEPVDAK